MFIKLMINDIILRETTGNKLFWIFFRSLAINKLIGALGVTEGLQTGQTRFTLGVTQVYSSKCYN